MIPMFRSMARKALIAAAVIWGTLGASAYAADFNFTVAHGSTSGSVNDQMFQSFKQQVEERSAGRIAVTVICCSQLALASQTEIEAMQRGETLTIANPTGAAFLGFVPEIGVLDVPFLFNSIRLTDKVLNEGEAMKMVSERIIAAGLRPMGYVVHGMLHTTTNGKFGDEIVHPEQLAGMKMRTLANKNHVDMWRALGTNPTPIAWGELFTAMEQGVIDGQSNSSNNIYDNRFYEVQKTVTTTKHLPLIGVFSISERVLRSLPQDLQDIVLEVGNSVVREWNGKYAVLEEDDLSGLAGKGMTVVYLTDEQRQVWGDMVAEVGNGIEDKLGNPELVQMLREDIAKAKSEM